MTWRARVVGDFQRNQIRLHLADVVGDHTEFVSQIGPGVDTQVAWVAAGVCGPEGMSLPEDVAEPLRDALNEFLGKPADDYRAKYEEARDALQVERARVDAFLSARAVGGVLQETGDEMEDA